MRKKESCIHTYFDLVSIILIYNSNLERESVFSERVLSKHAYYNVYVLKESMLKLGLHESWCWKCPFIFYTANDLVNGHLNKFHKLEVMNN